MGTSCSDQKYTAVIDMRSLCFCFLRLWQQSAKTLKGRWIRSQHHQVNHNIKFVFFAFQPRICTSKLSSVSSTALHKTLDLVFPLKDHFEKVFKECENTKIRNRKRSQKAHHRRLVLSVYVTWSDYSYYVESLLQVSEWMPAHRS